MSAMRKHLGAQAKLYPNRISRFGAMDKEGWCWTGTETASSCCTVGFTTWERLDGGARQPSVACQPRSVQHRCPELAAMVFTDAVVFVVISSLLNGRAAATNVVVLLVNNIRTDDLSCYDPQTPVPTPNIDRIASGGVLLRHHTVPALTRTANRAAHLTGRYPTRYGLQESEDGARELLHTLSSAGLSARETTFAKLFSAAGFKTKAVGSWELGWGCTSWADGCHSPLKHGFQQFYGIPKTVGPPADRLSPAHVEQMDKLASYLEVAANRSARRETYRAVSQLAWYQWLAEVYSEQANFTLQTALTPRLQRILDYLLVQDTEVAHWPYSLRGLTLPLLTESLEFIRRNGRLQKPFLLQHTFMQVHRPSVTAPHRVGASHINDFYDNILELDWAVGRILDQLEDSGILDNTVVYLASDHNDLMDYPGGAENLTDVRVPGMFMWRGLFREAEIKMPTTIMDLLPTIADAAGLGMELLDLQLDGRSLFFPLLTRGQPGVTRQYNYRGRHLDSVTLVLPHEEDLSVYKIYISRMCQLCEGTSQLYNMTADPFQSQPISEDSPVFALVSEDVREHLFHVDVMESQLGYFWEVMPLPDLFPWDHLSLYEPEVNVTSAHNFFQFLEAEFVFAAEAGSGDGPEDSGAPGEETDELPANEVDPTLQLFFLRQAAIEGSGEGAEEAQDDLTAGEVDPTLAEFFSRKIMENSEESSQDDSSRSPVSTFPRTVVEVITAPLGEEADTAEDEFLPATRFDSPLVTLFFRKPQDKDNTFI